MGTGERPHRLDAVIHRRRDDLLQPAEGAEDQHRSTQNIRIGRLQREGYLRRDVQRLINQDRNAFAASIARRVLPTPVASAKHKEGKPRSKSATPGNSR